MLNRVGQSNDILLELSAGISKQKQWQFQDICYENSILFQKKKKACSVCY
jgi:hypothetical protein